MLHTAGQHLKFCDDTLSVAICPTLNDPQDLDPDCLAASFPVHTVLPSTWQRWFSRLYAGNAGTPLTWAPWVNRWLRTVNQTQLMLVVDLHAYAMSLLFFVVDSVCPSVCLSQTSNWFFFFVSRWNWAIFWPSFLHDPLYKTLFFDFQFRPPNAQNLLPKIACYNATLPHRHPWSRTRQFSSSAPACRKMVIHWTSGLTVVAMATKFGLGVGGDPVAYQLVNQLISVASVILYYISEHNVVGSEQPGITVLASARS